MTPRITKIKIGNVWLRYVAPGRWEVYWYDKHSHNPIRRGFKAGTYKKAKQVAQNFDEQRLKEMRLLPTSRESKEAGGHTIQEALTESLKNNRANRNTKIQYTNFANLFHKWLTETFPGIKYWGDLKPKHLNQYILWCEKKRYAYDTIRLRLFIIRSTSKYMSENYWKVHRDISKGIKIKRSPIMKEPTVLKIDQVIRLLDHAKEHNANVYPIILLQAIAGLRIREAVHLREGDVDLKAGTITITETAHHKPKTSSSYRTIPIPKRVLETLSVVIQGRKVKGQDTYLFDSGRYCRRSHPGNRGQPWSSSGISRSLKIAFHKVYRDTRDKSFLDFKPRHLRATFATIAMLARVDSLYLRRYIGHSPESILEKHYQAVSIEDLKREVCVKIESSFRRSRRLNGVKSER